MASQTHEHQEAGLGTTISSGANLASTGLPGLPPTAIHCIVEVFSGTLYIENDGTDADANSLPIIGAGSVYTIKNCLPSEMAKFRVFAAAAYDARFQYAK